MKRNITVLILAAISISWFIPSARAQVGADEVKAMAELCSTSASVRFRGEIAGGLNRLFGKLLAGNGELEIGRGETEFLNSFKDERLRIEARRIYNDCAIKAIETIKERYRQQSLLNPEQLDIIDGTSTIVPIGRVFKVALNQSAVLHGGGVITVRASGNWRKEPSVKVTNGDAGIGSVLRESTVLSVPNRNGCTITYLPGAGRQDAGYEYSFFYECR